LEAAAIVDPEIVDPKIVDPEIVDPEIVGPDPDRALVTSNARMVATLRKRMK
jgi:hypothetical protein